MIKRIFGVFLFLISVLVISCSSDEFNEKSDVSFYNTENADLLFENVLIGAKSINAGDKIKFLYTLKNSGASFAPESRIRIYFSEDSKYNKGDIYKSSREASELEVNSEKDFVSNLTIPNVVDGKYYLILIADANKEIEERDEQNNVFAKPIYVGETFEDGTVDVFFSPRGGVREEIIKNIGLAKISIDISMYSYSDSTLRKVVREASKRGVKVRLLVNKSILSRVKPMEEDGVDVRTVKQTNHHKFAVIDAPIDGSENYSESTLLTGSGNWSTSSNFNYDEDFIVFTGSKSKTKSFQSEFNKLWNHSISYGEDYLFEDKVEISMPENSGVYFTSDNYSPYVYGDEWRFRAEIEENEGPVGEKIIEAINSAEKSIKIATAHFRRPDIYLAVKKAVEKGVIVQMITDQAEFSAASHICPDEKNKFLDECIDELSETTEVKYKMYSPVWNYRTAKQMHLKYIIIDDKEVLTGSFNWSFTAESKNFENLVTLKGEEVAKYIDNFNKIYNYGSGNFESLLEDIKEQNGEGPCAFQPISLTVKEAKALKFSYKYGACR